MQFTPFGARQCPRCNMYIVIGMAASSAFTNKQNSAGSSNDWHNGYKSKVHTLNRLASMQAQRPMHISPEKFGEICRYVHKHHILRRDLDNIWVGREIMFACNMHNEYNFVQFMLTHLNGVQPPQISPITHHEISILISLIHRTWREVQRAFDDEEIRQSRIAGRKLELKKRNAPNAGFAIHHIAQLLGHPELQKFSATIWEKDNVRDKNYIMEKVFEAYDWEFHPVKVPRMAGPANQAFFRRYVSTVRIKTILANHDWEPISSSERADLTSLALQRSFHLSFASDENQRHPLTTDEQHAVLQAEAAKVGWEVRNNTTECRGRNYTVAASMAGEDWAAVEDCVRRAIYYMSRLTNFNPLVHDKELVRRVQELCRRHKVKFVGKTLQELKDYNDTKTRKKKRGIKRGRKLTSFI
jgi:hypothetical protein